MDQSRRSFLESSGMLAAGLAAAPAILEAAGGGTEAALPPTVDTRIAAANRLPCLSGPMPGEIRKGDMIYRPLGRPGPARTTSTS